MSEQFVKVKAEEIKVGDFLAFPRRDDYLHASTEGMYYQAPVVEIFPCFTPSETRTSVEEKRNILYLDQEGNIQSLIYNDWKTMFVVSRTAAKSKKLVTGKVADCYVGKICTSLSEYFPHSTGADPELFVADGTDLLPAFEFLPSKETTAGGRPFWDGFQAEFCVQPTHCHEGVTNRIQQSLHRILATARQKGYKNPTFVRNSTVTIPEEVLRNTDPARLELGCSPSLNAYGMRGELEQAQLLPQRWAGGHLHSSLDASKLGDEEYGLRLTKALDRTLGVISVAMARGLDNTERRRYYGLAGEYRMPKHGIEYRTLSNFWLLTPYITHLVLDMFRWYLKMGLLLPHTNWTITEQQAVEIINTADADAAQVALEENKAELKGHISSIYPGLLLEKVEKTYQFITKGIRNFVDVPRFGWEKSWGIGPSGTLNFSAGLERSWVRYGTNAIG